MVNVTTSTPTERALLFGGAEELGHPRPLNLNAGTLFQSPRPPPDAHAHRNQRALPGPWTRPVSCSTRGAPNDRSPAPPEVKRSNEVFKERHGRHVTSVGHGRDRGDAKRREGTRNEAAPAWGSQKSMPSNTHEDVQLQVLEVVQGIFYSRGESRARSVPPRVALAKTPCAARSSERPPRRRTSPERPSVGPVRGGGGRAGMGVRGVGGWCGIWEKLPSWDSSTWASELKLRKNTIAM